MDKVFVAQGVANRTVSAEAAIDHAIAETSQLLIDIVQARETLGVSAGVIDASVAKASQSIAALSQARQALVAAHGELVEAKLRVGIRTKMAGCFDEVNPVGPTELRRAV